MFKLFKYYATFALNIDCPSHNFKPVLEKLNLDTLSHRRINANLDFLFKLVSWEVIAPGLLGTVCFNVSSTNLRKFSPFLHSSQCVQIRLTIQQTRVMQLDCSEVHGPSLLNYFQFDFFILLST